MLDHIFEIALLFFCFNPILLSSNSHQFNFLMITQFSKIDLILNVLHTDAAAGLFWWEAGVPDTF